MQMQITGPQMTDSQKREQQLDRLFQMARKAGDEDDDDVPKYGVSAAAIANAPDADDW